MTEDEQEDMRVTYTGKQIDNMRTVADYNIKNESTLQASWKLRGGGKFCYECGTPTNGG